MRNTKHLFIVNPRAGRGLAIKTEKQLEDLFGKISRNYEGVEYKVIRTQYPTHATDIAREYSKKGNYRIYAVGGDGTLNEVLNGMAESDSSLAIIPCGTGNDFIKTMSGTEDRKELLYRSILGTEKEVDLCRNDSGYFINIASVGFDAIVNYEAQKYKKFRLMTSGIAYFGGIMDALRKKELIHLRYEIDGVPYEKDVFLIAVCNGMFYGGSFMMSPESDLTDGYFNVVVIDDIPLHKFAGYIPLLIKGKHLGIPKLTHIKSKKITISSDKELIVNVDGESQKKKEVTFEIAPKNLKLIVPKGCTLNRHDVNIK